MRPTSALTTLFMFCPCSSSRRFAMFAQASSVRTALAVVCGAPPSASSLSSRSLHRFILSLQLRSPLRLALPPPRPPQLPCSPPRLSHPPPGSGFVPPPPPLAAWSRPIPSSSPPHSHSSSSPISSLLFNCLLTLAGIGAAWLLGRSVEPTVDYLLPSDGKLAVSDINRAQQTHRDEQAYLRAGAPLPPLPPAAVITSEQRAAFAADLFPSLSGQLRMELLDTAWREDMLRQLALPECSVADVLSLLRHPPAASSASPSGSNAVVVSLDAALAGLVLRSEVQVIARLLTVRNAHWAQHDAARVAVAREHLDLLVHHHCLCLVAQLRVPGSVPSVDQLSSLVFCYRALDRQEELGVACEAMQIALEQADNTANSAGKAKQIPTPTFVQRMMVPEALASCGDWTASVQHFRRIMGRERSTRIKRALLPLAYAASQDPHAGKGVALSYAVAALQAGFPSDLSVAMIDSVLSIEPSIDLPPADLTRLHYSDLACLHSAEESQRTLQSIMDEPPQPPPLPSWIPTWVLRLDPQARATMLARQDRLEDAAAACMLVARLLHEEGSSTRAEQIDRAIAMATTLAEAARY